MKYLVALLFGLFAFSLNAQTIEGAWKLTHQNGKPVTNQEFIKIYQDGYFAYGAKETGTNKFLQAGGGLFTMEGSDYAEHLDFYTADPDQVGTKNQYKIDFADNKLVISGKVKGKDLIEIWEKVGSREDDLTQNWVITGRKVDGETRSMTPGARRTVKILSGGRFQWIAFNSETKEFSGTGGGTYEAKDGKYTEQITFFSRDDSRVGASLSFDYEVKDNQWHHSGLSSTGNPIYEIWSSYREAYLNKK
ncbi:MAG: hypothetical protein JJU34_09810 [Lunatimonas sp.]|uniref:DUF4488 domain-containing protein n=1 Tax=Lunatimonas sp. TaxID=2060141 RepID=UPI00263A5CC8|nr:DUF4488 domain-containing protein [Lunatimonas sp.]MCC5937568.1 hypothetical protein [Lunatimonas sp.]